MTTTDGAAFFVPAAADVYAQLVASPAMAAGLTSPDPGCPGYVVPQVGKGGGWACVRYVAPFAPTPAQGDLEDWKVVSATRPIL